MRRILILLVILIIMLIGCGKKENDIDQETSENTTTEQEVIYEDQGTPDDFVASTEQDTEIVEEEVTPDIPQDFEEDTEEEETINYGDEITSEDLQRNDESNIEFEEIIKAHENEPGVTVQGNTLKIDPNRNLPVTITHDEDPTIALEELPQTIVATESDDTNLISGKDFAPGWYFVTASDMPMTGIISHIDEKEPTSFEISDDAAMEYYFDNPIRFKNGDSIEVSVGSVSLERWRPLDASEWE